MGWRPGPEGPHVNIGASGAFPSRCNLNELKWALIGTCHRHKTTDLAHAEARWGGDPRAGYGGGPRLSLAVVLGAGQSTRDGGKKFKNPDERCTVTVASLGKGTPGLKCGRQREQMVAAPKVLAGGHSMDGRQQVKLTRKVRGQAWR